MNFLIVGSIVAAVRSRVAARRDAQSWVNAANLAGLLCGAIASGLLSDRRGDIWLLPTVRSRELLNERGTSLLCGESGKSGNCGVTLPKPRRISDMDRRGHDVNGCSNR